MRTWLPGPAVLLKSLPQNRPAGQAPVLTRKLKPVSFISIEEVSDIYQIPVGLFDLDKECQQFAHARSPVSSTMMSSFKGGRMSSSVSRRLLRNVFASFCRVA